MSELCGPGCKNQFLTASKEWDRAFDDVLRNEKVKVVILSHASAASRNNILDTSDPSSKLSKIFLSKLQLPPDILNFLITHFLGSIGR